MTRLVVFLSASCLLLVVTMLIVYAFMESKNNAAIDEIKEDNKKIQEDIEVLSRKVCQSKSCLTRAEELKEIMMEEADPCSNFYNFACGNFHNVYPIPKTSSRFGYFDIASDQLSQSLRGILETNNRSTSLLLRKSSILYESCMDDDSLEHIGYDDLNMLINQIFTNFDVHGPIDKILARLQMHGVEQASLVLPRDYYLQNHDVMGNYTLFIKDIIQNVTDDTGDAVDLFAKYVVNLETELAQIIVPEEKRRDSNKMYNLMTLKQLDDACRKAVGEKFSFKRYLKEMTNWHNMPDDQLLNLVDVEYFDQVMSKLNAWMKNSTSDFGLYLQWRIIERLIPFTVRAMRMLIQKFKIVLTGQKKEEERWKECVNIANKYFGMPLSAEYVRTHFTRWEKAEIIAMVSNIKQTYSELLNETTWMDEQSKAKSSVKINLMKEYLAYPKELADDDTKNAYFDDFYGRIFKFTPISNGTFLRNIVFLGTYMFHYDIRKILNSPKDGWFTAPATVNAFYEPSYNSFYLPVGILQPPFFEIGLPSALNYGGIGMVIGHELTHGFDDTGSQRNEFGILEKWWSNKTVEQFRQRADCFVNQYSNFVIPGTNIHVNGKNTQGENIADNGGVKEAFLAYKKLLSNRKRKEAYLPDFENYSNEQMFFIGLAQIWCASYTKERLVEQVLSNVHSPEMFRLIGSLQNSQYFREAFNCSSSSYMVSKNPCVLW